MYPVPPLLLLCFLYTYRTTYIQLFEIHICSLDSYSHSLRGAAMLLSMEDVLLAAVLGLWFCAAWPVFWLWAGWLWPAWAGFCAWLGLVGGLEASMLLPMLLPSCSRLMCRTTAVALNACWREKGNGKIEDKNRNRELSLCLHFVYHK